MRKLRCIFLLIVSLIIVIANVSFAVQPLSGKWKATGTGKLDNAPESWIARMSFGFVVSDDRSSLNTNEHIDLTIINLESNAWVGSRYIPYYGTSVTMEIRDGNISYIIPGTTIEGKFTSETMLEGMWHVQVGLWVFPNGNGTWTASYIGNESFVTSRRKLTTTWGSIKTARN